MRAGCPVSSTIVVRFLPPCGSRVPSRGVLSPQLPTTTAAPSGSARQSKVALASSTRAISAVTAANTSDGAAEAATSVATRLSAACSSKSTRRPSRASLLAIAVETSSVKSASRASVSSGSRSGKPTAIAPQIRPSTRIGLAAPEPTPAWRMAAAISPGRSVGSSRRAGRRVAHTSAKWLGPSSKRRVPMGTGNALSLQPLTTRIADPSVS